MFTYAAECLGLDLERSFFVGDALSDIKAGRDAGCQTALVRTGRGALHEPQVVAAYPQCTIVDDLAQAAAWIRHSTQ